MVTAGTGLGVASWARVISTTVLVFTLSAHRSPDGSKTTVKGPYMSLVKLASRCHVTVGVGRVNVHLPVGLDGGPFPALAGPAIVPPWETTTLPGAKGPIPAGAAEATVGATSTGLAKPTSAHARGSSASFGALAVRPHRGEHQAPCSSLAWRRRGLHIDGPSSLLIGVVILWIS